MSYTQVRRSKDTSYVPRHPYPLEKQSERESMELWASAVLEHVLRWIFHVKANAIKAEDAHEIDGDRSVANTLSFGIDGVIEDVITCFIAIRQIPHEVEIHDGT